MMSKPVSYIKTENGTQVLYVNGKPLEGLAYITYLSDKNCYKDFADAGYRLFSFPVFFGYQNLNERTQLKVFTKGIYDEKDPDFSIFDRDMEKILEACPNAYVFPRVNVSLPKWWEQENPDELNHTAFPDQPQSSVRACAFSDKWAQEVKRELQLFIDHVQTMPYKDHIIGYQIAGGNTEEWLPFDRQGNVGKPSDEKFAAYKEKTGIAGTHSEYMAFLSEMMAGRLCELAHHVKELTAHKFVVGCFYGYVLTSVEIESNHHALSRVLACDDIDFICSPIAYDNARKAGMDHVYMLPIDSVKLHNKLYFSENDSRTSLSRPVNDMPAYNTSVWYGPKTEEETLEILKMHFARPLLNGHACWWFDMWGGWFKSEAYMDFMRTSMEEYHRAMDHSLQSVAEVAVFVDEKTYCAADDYALSRQVCGNLRHTLGTAGTPYDMYLASDFDLVDMARYKAVILPEPAVTKASARIAAYCAENGTALLRVNADNQFIDTLQLRQFYLSSGVHLYSGEDMVVYGNESYLFLHTVRDGDHQITLPEEYTLTDVFTGQVFFKEFHAPIGKSYLLRKEK